MDKQKRIEEMAKNTGACEHPERNCLEKKGDCAECSMYAISQSLHNAGYGNLKDFVQWLKAKGQTQYDNADYIDVDDLDELLKEYGID